jgi:hypothetical protein
MDDLMVWTSKPLEKSLLIWSSKLDMDGSVIWVSKPSAVGLTGLGLKIGSNKHVVASRSLRQGKAKSRRYRVRQIDEENLECFSPRVIWDTTYRKGNLGNRLRFMEDGWLLG